MLSIPLTITLLTLIPLINSSQMAGPITLTLPDSCYDAFLSDDASTIICTSLYFNQAYILKNNGL